VVKFVVEAGVSYNLISPTGAAKNYQILRQTSLDNYPFYTTWLEVLLKARDRLLVKTFEINKTQTILDTIIRKEEQNGNNAEN